MKSLEFLRSNMKKHKILILSITIIFLSTLFINQQNILLAGLKDFKQDFYEKKIDSADNQEKDENKTSSDKTNIIAQATATEDTDNKLRNFYNDFKPEKNKDESTNTNPPPSTTEQRYYHRHYNPEYYHYYYPYYYPYYNFYPREIIVIREDKYQYERGKQEIQPVTVAEPERHTWYNTSLDYQNISKNLTSVGIMFSIVSAGKIDEISYGAKIDYDLFTEKEDTDHYSLPVYNIGFIIGKQMGKGLVESFIAYCHLEDLSGISLKLSTNQWLRKNVFVIGELGVSIINDSPLTDAFAGIGVGNSILQFILGYRSQNSVNTRLNGPEFKLGVVL